MTRKITYPLIIAIGLSPVAGALYEGEEGQIHVHTLEGWLITGELHQEPVCEECEDYEWCSTYLANKKISEDDGWRPEALLFLPEEGWV